MKPTERMPESVNQGLQVNISESDIHIRSYQHPDDYPKALQVWEKAGTGIHIADSDRLEEIEKLIHKSPGLFFVAEYDQRIIGTVMGGFDGRRGLIYHLAVLPEFRNLHTGTRLMHTLEDQLQKMGCTKVYLFVLPENQGIFDFYQKQGYEKMTVIPFTKYLD
jgi:ribosomal protein S18 acetylase RimI-like enzyme